MKLHKRRDDDIFSLFKVYVNGIRKLLVRQSPT